MTGYIVFFFKFTKCLTLLLCDIDLQLFIMSICQLEIKILRSDVNVCISGNSTYLHDVWLTYFEYILFVYFFCFTVTPSRSKMLPWNNAAVEVLRVSNIRGEM